ncbi:MAG: S1C family serine protease, partial [Chloroflexota bacterium]
ATALTELSDALATEVENAGKSVVRVKGRRRLGASGIVWRDDGTIVTANHVVKRNEGVTVTLPDGASHKATVVGRDASTDLAVLRVEGERHVPAERSEDVKVGHLVLALGRPGQTVQATLGIISALGTESWRTPMGGEVDRYLQTDVVMYPGFSGGPLINTQGQLLALNSSALVRGVSVAVPVATVSQVVSSLVEHGRIQRGYLGISTQPVRLPSSVAEELGQDSGLLIVGVEADSPADKGGLVLGDAIVDLDGNRVRHHDDLLSLLSGERVGRKTPVRILRGGQLQTVNVTIGER